MSNKILKHTNSKSKLTDEKLASLGADSLIFIDDTKQIITKASGSTYFKTLGLGDVCNYIIGTQAAATNKFTGDASLYKSDITDGLKIDYLLPYEGTTDAATLKLKCIDGDSDEKGVYISSTQVTNELRANTIIHLVYRNDGWYVEDIHEPASDDDIESVYNSVFGE